MMIIDTLRHRPMTTRTDTRFTLLARLLFMIPVLSGVVACGGGRENNSRSATTTDELTPETGLEQAITAGQGVSEQVIPRTYVYKCDNNFQFTVHVDQDSAALILPDQRVTIPLVVSASGARYSDGKVTFWSKGNTALLEVGNKSYSGCKIAPPEDVWGDAKSRGVDFRAIGQEPGWYLEIDDGKQVLFVGNYGELQITTQAPAPTKSGAGATTYNIETSAHRLTINVQDRPCSDVMSGEQFPSTVNVTVDEKSYQGCGRSLRS
jgi:membrane-bound inhibitor of C-type lysozyme